MGLDVSHGCFHGAYSAFNTLRKAVELKEVAEKLNKSDMGSPHLERHGGVRGCVLKFGDGLELAHGLVEDVKFY